MDLQTLFLLAYLVLAYQLEGVPGWIRSERFDFIAKAPAGAKREQTRAMLQTLLAERSNLRSIGTPPKCRLRLVGIHQECHRLPATDAHARTRGNKHQAALRALTFKWIRILFRCWQDGIPYDETRHQAALRRRHLSTGTAANSVVNLEWKTVAGFQKISANNS